MSNKYFTDNKELIDPTIHKFLYVLMKYIFYGKSQTKKETREKLKIFINKKINQNKQYESYHINLNISFEHNEKKNCNLDNLVEILNFTRIHNFAMASEIIENIMIRLISFSFQSKSSDSFGKYIFNNLNTLRTEKKVILDWINNEKLKYLFNNRNKDLSDILNYDEITSNYEFNTKKDEDPQFIKECTFIQFLLKIQKMRFMLNIPKNDNNKKNYTTLASQSSFLSKTTIGDTTSIYYNESCLFYGSDIGKTEKNVVIPLALSVLISSYIYHQNRHSPLIKYKQKDDLIDLPFKYDLSEAGIIDLYLGTIMKPIRIEPKIEVIELNKNNFGVEGLLEMYKAIIFNKYIKKISIKSCGIKSKHLKYLLRNLKPFKNNSIEVLDISSNFIKSDADEYLVKIIENLKGLKTFIFSENNIKGGIAPFFVELKNLYRQKKTKLETLILINCSLDNNDFYELGELLTSKFCQLKCLCLNMNKIPSNSNFFKALKKNRSLKEIYLYDSGTNSDKEDEINRIISNTNLESLYLYINQIHDYNIYIRIIYRNCLIKNEKENQNKNISFDKPCLCNLNMNRADCFNKNINKNKLLQEGINRTNLSILDLISVLNGYKIENKLDENYYKGINSIKEDLVNKLKENKALEKEINNCKIDIEKLKKNIEYMEEFENIDIENIINDYKSKYKMFIIKEANKLKSNLSFNNEKERKKKMEQFVDYISLKRVEKILEEKQKIFEKKKLILI